MNGGLNMIIVHVHVSVKSDRTEDFILATKENASQSRKEDGVIQFDVLRSENNPTQFLLIEIFKDKSAADYHKETIHYLRWRETVADMMAESRTSEKYHLIDPDKIPR